VVSNQSLWAEIPELKYLIYVPLPNTGRLHGASLATLLRLGIVHTVHSGRVHEELVRYVRSRPLFHVQVFPMRSRKTSPMTQKHGTPGTSAS
jgi:hypothetical protein